MAEEVVIAGTFSGSLICRNRVEITATGHVTGKVETRSFNCTKAVSSTVNCVCSLAQNRPNQPPTKRVRVVRATLTLLQNRPLLPQKMFLNLAKLPKQHHKTKRTQDRRHVDGRASYLVCAYRITAGNGSM